MKEFDYLQQKLKNEMITGEMHKTLRDVGRLAGGMIAGGSLTHADVQELENIAVALSNTPRLGKKTWHEAVEHGKKQLIPKFKKTLYNSERKTLDYDSVIGGEWELKQDTIKKNDIPECINFQPINELKRYLELVFRPDEYVSFVTESFYSKDAEKQLPTSGAYDRTQKKLLLELNNTDDITNVIGDWNSAAGAWIRHNPVDGKGIHNSNVTNFRHVLVESDAQSLELQYSIYQELQLPITVLVHSGKKSLHAIVKIEASNVSEYEERVDFLYELCKKNGLELDKQNRNPSRLSRMPGIMRGEKQQYIIAENIGHKSWNDWVDWVEYVNDELPAIECLEADFDNLPPLTPVLIEGVLRQGHKLLLSGPSKAGKSFDLIELAIAIAEGGLWHGWQCTQGRVLYVNLELDEISLKHRFRNIYDTKKISKKNISNIDIWNLRGRSCPFDRLAPKLIKRAQEKKYIAVIIDPIYKVLTGDENSAGDMAKFCNQFDKICRELKCATIACHHHSKGSQGQKNAGDRPSGSGVFLRDPDTQLDLIELEISESCRKQIINIRHCEVIREFLTESVLNWEQEISQDVQVVSRDFHSAAISLLAAAIVPDLAQKMATEYEKIEYMTAWRLEGNLREFRTSKPLNCFFDYPVHVSDPMNLLQSAKAEGELENWKTKKKTETPAERKRNKNRAISKTYNLLNTGVSVTVEEMGQSMGRSLRQMNRDISEHPDFLKENGDIIKK